MKRRLFRWGWLKRNRLESPVISVGSVSAGGGKDPMVLMLARILRHRATPEDFDGGISEVRRDFAG
jgi:tetraacyldisaccharide 4'-kinase